MKEAKQVEQIQNEVAVSSVSLTKNSKGTNIGVKVYNADPQIAQTTAIKIFDDLSKRYKVEE